MRAPKEADPLSLHKVRWNEKRLDPVILRLLGEDLREYNARAIRNLIERHLLVHAALVGECLVRHSARTRETGWLWGATVNLLDDVKVHSVDPGSHDFTVLVGDSTCVGRVDEARVTQAEAAQAGVVQTKAEAAQARTESDYGAEL